MKKRDLSRMYNFSDAELIVTAKEKIAFIRRDATEFESFGITLEKIAELEKYVNAFSELYSDVEAIYDKVILTQARDSKAEELRVAIRKVLLVAQLTFGTGSARYKSFGVRTLSKQRGAFLVTAGKTVALIGASFLPELVEGGVTQAMLSRIDALCDELEDLVIEQQIKTGGRNVFYEHRVTLGNALYTALMSYTAVGLSIWETTNVARYNDYVIYAASRKKAAVEES